MQERKRSPHFQRFTAWLVEHVTLDRYSFFVPFWLVFLFFRCSFVLFVVQARIRHLFMTKKQIRDERLQKYRVGFMGMRIPRAYDTDD